MNESETRAEYIDPALAAAGWGVVEGSRIRREYAITQGRLEGFGRRGKSLTADYVLIYRNTKLAVVEAKAWDEPLTLGVAQAKNYAEKLKIRFTYASNGKGIYAIDMETGQEQEITAYPSPEELWNRTFAKVNASRDRFAAVLCPSRTKEVTFKVASIKTSRSIAFWKPSQRDEQDMVRRERMAIDEIRGLLAESTADRVISDACGS